MSMLDSVCCYRRSSMVSLSVCLSVTTVSPAKTAEPIKMPFETWIRVGPRNNLLRDLPGKDYFWGDDVEISPHAVDECSDWPAAEAVECLIKFSQWKSLPCDAAPRQNFWPLAKSKIHSIL